MLLKSLVSLGAAGLVVVHMAWPELRVDAITLGLVIVAVLPWLSKLIESAKFPGGWEIKFRDVQSAVQKVMSDAPVVARTSAAAPKTMTFVQVADTDPNLALVGLRIEIEKRIRAIGQKIGITNERSMIRILTRLRENGILRDTSLSGIQELVMAGNQAAHGARVDPSAAAWALEYGPQVLAVLDNKLSELEDG
jgi:hypothetical protein